MRFEMWDVGYGRCCELPLLSSHLTSPIAYHTSDEASLELLTKIDTCCYFVNVPSNLLFSFPEKPALPLQHPLYCREQQRARSDNQ